MIKDIQELNFPSYATMSAATCPQPDMGEWVITSQIKIDGQIAPDFSYDWEVVFQGHKYIQPLRKPQGSKDNEKFSSVINLTFQHWAIWQLKRFPFVTMQPIDSGTAVADEEVADVSLNLGDFSELFKQVLAYYYGDKITLQLNPEWQYKEEAEVISISHTKVWNVLVQVFHEKFGVRWAIEPNGSYDKYVIKVGYPTTEQNHIFEYGFEGGLMKVERQVQSEEICNMLKGRGGEKNLPFRYFKALDPNNPDFNADPDWIEELANIPFSRLMPATFRSYVQGWKAAHISKYPGYTAKGEANAYSPWAYRKGFTDTKFHPVEFVADEIVLSSEGGARSVEILPGYSPFVKKGSSLDKYGPLLNTLDDDDEIFPTIQGVVVNPYGRIDQTVAIEPITSDDIAESAESDAQITTFRQPWPEITEKVAKNSRKTIVLTGDWFSVPTGKTANFDEGGKSVVLTKDTLRIWYDFKTGKWYIGLQEVAVGYENVVIEETSVVLESATGGVVPASGIPSGTYRYKVTCKVYNTATEDYNVTVSLENPTLTDATLDDKWSNVWHIWVKNIWQTSKQTGETDKQYAERVWRPILGDREGNEAKVLFTSGALAISDDYEFTIVATPEYDTSKTLDGVQSHWKITLAKSDADLESLGVYLPSTKRQAIAGDYFVFLGIDPQFYYTDWAERRVDDNKKDVLGDKKDIKPTWVVQTDRVRLNGEGKPNALIRQLHPGDTLRLADKRFIEGDYETLYLSSLTYTYREPTKEDAALNPDVEIVLSDRYEVSANIVSTLQGEVSALAKQVGSISNIEQIMRAVGDKLYLRKDGLPDRSMSPTEFASLLTSLGFRSGMVGGAGWGIYKDANGNWVIEADRFMARQDLEVNNLIINQVLGKGGTEVDCAAFMEITRVEELANGYKCYFDQHEGTIANLFHVDDVAWNNRYTPENADLKFYRRRVTEVGADYVVLTKPLNGSARPTDWPDSGVNGVGIPAEGDVIVHRGNYTDKNRQYIKVRDVVGGGYERYIEGLDSVTAEGVEYYFVGRQAGVHNGRPRFYLGDENGYIEWVNGVLNIKGKIVATSTIGDKTLDQYIKDVVPPVTQEDIEGFVEAIVDPKIEGIQNQIDGVIESFFGFGAPTLTNSPANEWTTDEARKAHNRDTYTDKTEYVDDVTTPTAGQSWRWQYTSPTDYGWIKIADSDATRALLDAAKAQDTADKKRRTFISTNEHPTPYPPYDEGDIWVNATYGTQYSNDILRCITSKAEGQSFAISDWTLASKYTDDSALNTFISDYEDTIVFIKDQLDGKAETYYQTTDPSTSWPADKYLEHKGDLWYCTVDIAGTDYKKGTTWYWDGSQWKKQDVPQSVFDTIDGKADIYVTKPTSYHVNDLWFLEADYTGNNGLGNPKKDYPKGTLMVATQSSTTFNATHWAKKDRYTDDTLAQSAKDEIAGYQYIKEALKGNTVINGGLVLSRLIKLGTWTGNGDKATLTNVYAGLNGVYSNPKSPFLWGGADMVDRFFNEDGTPRTSDPANYAKAMLRMDGSAYFSGGNVGFEKDGSGWFGDRSTGNAITFADGAMTFGNGIKIDLGNGKDTTFGGIQTTLETVLNFMNNLGNNLVPIVLVNGVPTPTSWGNITASSPLYAVKSVKGFYSEEFVSAHGINANAGGGAVGLDWDAIESQLTDNGYATQSWVEGKGYLTSSDLTPYALQSSLTAHTGNSTIHITASERTLWNQTATNLSAILGTDSDTVINKWEEVVSFLDTYTEADTLANILSNKADKATTLAGYGITDAYTKTDADGAFVSKAGDTMTGTLEISGGYLDINGSYITGLDNGGFQFLADGSLTMEMSKAALYPNGTRLLGTSASRWHTVYATNVDVATKVKIGDCEITWDADKGGLKFSTGIYSEGWISARGSNANAGGVTGGIDEATLEQYLTANGYATQQWVTNKGYVTLATVNSACDGVQSWVNQQGFLKSVAWGDVTGKPTWIGATKPSYNFSEIGSKPTTLSGYGITDAKIANGVITLGSNTITPITSHQSLAGKLDKYGTDGVLEVARYIDFHTISNGVVGTEDYTVRLDAGSASTSRSFSFPATGGTLATESFVTGKGYLTSITKAQVEAVLTGNITSHTHSQYLTSHQSLANYLYAFGGTDFDPATYDGYYAGMTTKSGITTDWWHILSMNWGTTHTVGNKTWVSQLALPTKTIRGLRYRTGASATAYSDWVTVIDSTNIGSYAITAHQSLANYVTLNGAQTISAKKTFSNGLAITGGATENTSMPFFLGIKAFADGGDVQWLTANKVCAAIGAATTSALGNYLPLTGGTLTGTLTLHTNGTAAYNQGLRINRLSSANWATLTIGYVGSGTSNSSDNTWLIGTPANSNSLIFNRNNASETVGLCLKGHSNTDIKWNNNNVWHSGNDGSGSGLDADLLDGVHLTSLFRQLGTNPNLDSYGDSSNANGIFYINTTTPSNGIPFSYGSVLSLNTNTSSVQIGFQHESNEPHYRQRWWSNNGSGWSSWKRLAFTSSNVASATRLQGSYSLWGQTFYGNNVSGNIIGAAGGIAIHETNEINSFNGNLYLNHRGAGHALGTTSNIIALANGGRFGIGTSSPVYKLDVNGDTLTHGWVRTTGNTGWYNETYGGGWYMSDSTWIRTYNNKSIYAGTGIIRSDYYFDRQGYGGSSWNNGYGAYNVAITDNSSQTPLMVAYRAGKTADVTGANRLFAMELLNSGATLRLAFGGAEKVSISSGGAIGASGSISSSGNISASGTLSAYSSITSSVGNISASNGTVYGKVGVWSDGYVSARGQNTSSDATLKRNLTPFEIALNKIANAPSVEFDWREGSHDLGSVAQYWQDVNPLLTPKGPDGYLTLQYGKTALLASISIAKEVESVERRVERLERENKELKRKIEILERR